MPSTQSASLTLAGVIGYSSYRSTTFAFYDYDPRQPWIRQCWRFHTLGNKPVGLNISFEKFQRDHLGSNRLPIQPKLWLAAYLPTDRAAVKPLRIIDISISVST
jgi:hypothetical protein